MNRNRWSIVTVIAIGLLAATSSSQVISDAKADPTDPIPSTEPLDPIDPLDPLSDPLDPLGDDPISDPLDDPISDPLGDAPTISDVNAEVIGDDVVLTGKVQGDMETLIVEEIIIGAQATIQPDGSFTITCPALAEFAYLQASDANGPSELVQYEID